MAKIWRIAAIIAASVCISVLALPISDRGLSQSAESPARLKVCIASVVARGYFDGSAIFRHSFRVYGKPEAGVDGYFVAALDFSDAAWIQGSGGVRAEDLPGPTPRRIDVSNVSIYPLRYVLIRARTGDAISYGEMQRRARLGQPLSLRELEGRLATNEDACEVDLKSERPDTSNCKCPNL